MQSQETFSREFVILDKIIKDLKAKLPFLKNKNDSEDDEASEGTEIDRKISADKTGMTDISTLENDEDQSPPESKSILLKLFKKIKELIDKHKKSKKNKEDDSIEDGELGEVSQSEDNQPSVSADEEAKKKRSLIIKVVVAALVVVIIFSDEILPPSDDAKVSDQSAEEGASQSRKKKDSESPVAETPAAETPAAETPAAETPAAETPAAETPAAETPAAETPAAETPAAETPATETPAAETPAAETPAADENIFSGIDEENKTDNQAPVSESDLLQGDKNSNQDIVEEGLKDQGENNFNESVLKDLENQVKEAKTVTEQKEYVVPPNYEYIGRGLVYNCTGKHWACVDGASYKICETNYAAVKYLNKPTECHPNNVFETQEGCEITQNRNITANLKTDFCEKK